MAEDSLEFAFDYFSERYGVSLSDFEKQEMVKNISGFFAVLHEWDKKHSHKVRGENK
jgi:CTP:phosphocholine cytidylyltransferase-like protein